MSVAGGGTVGADRAARAGGGRRQRILVAMSGGVDSSVAAAELVEAGHEVVGATMKTFCYSGTPEATKTCCGLDGIRDARRVADQLGVSHYVFDVEDEFTRDVIDDFVDEYSRGRTPNPCVRCNSNTKFRDLFRRGRALRCDGVASGHYVRLDRSAGEPRLLRGRDSAKDQSYFLWGLPAELLDKLHFPVGDLEKAAVRERARALGLVTADKPESQEICFVPTGDYRDLLQKRLLPTHPALSPGPMVDWTGRVVGRHDGYSSFTVGQRKGIGGGRPEPWFVLEIRPATREVVVGPRELLDVRAIVVRELNWLTAPPSPGARIRVQVRYRAPALACRVESMGKGGLALVLEEPAPAAAPGQSSVLFDGDRVLGGGRIAHAAVAALAPDPGSEVAPEDGLDGVEADHGAAAATTPFPPKRRTA